MSAPDTRFYHISPAGVMTHLASAEEALEVQRQEIAFELPEPLSKEAAEYR